MVVTIVKFIITVVISFFVIFIIFMAIKFLTHSNSNSNLLDQDFFIAWGPILIAMLLILNNKKIG